MIEVVLTPRAERDLEEIWFSIAPDGPSAADRLLRRISDRVLQLAPFPFRGAPRPELGRSFRILVVDPYLVIYEPSPERVEIIRILHGARHLSATRR